MAAILPGLKMGLVIFIPVPRQVAECPFPTESFSKQIGSSVEFTSSARASSRNHFEPMAISSLHFLTVITVLFRLSRQEKDAVPCLTPGHVRWERHGVLFFPKPTYNAKNQTASLGLVESFPVLDRSIHDPRGQGWCPVRDI